MKFTLATWNSLADCYVRGQVGGQDARGRWESRSLLLRETLLEAMDSIDVFCMQEVDHFEDFYFDVFESKGFTTVYMQRPTKNDGCLVAFNTARFELKQTQLIDLDQLSHLDRQLQRTGRSKFAKQNVAVLALVTNKSSGEHVLLATCHLHWNPDLPEVKFAQAYYITDRISSFREQFGNFPVVFTGDFNSLPSDEVYKFITASPSARATAFTSIEAALTSQIELNSYTFGPSTKFLCDTSLSRLCRWMRILGVDVAQDTWDAKADAASSSFEDGPRSPRSSRSNSERLKKQSLQRFFQRARDEHRVILTTSKTMLQRASCPPSYYVKPGNMEAAMVDIYREFGLEVKRERFLTVCGKCGGEIEETTLGDARMEGKLLPTDRQVFVCVQCSQPYWWSDNENSSPAKAMRQADLLHDIIVAGLQQRDRSPPTSDKCSVAGAGNSASILANDADPSIQHIRGWNSPPAEESHEFDGFNSDGQFEKAESLAPSRTESPLSARFAVRDAVLSSSSKQRATLSTASTSRREGAPCLSLESQSMAPNGMTATAVPTSSITEEGVDCGELNTPNEVAQLYDGRARMLVELRSVFAGKEPPLTNWNGSFMGTLDYIFVSRDWTVENVRLVPRPILSGNGGEEEDLRPSGKGITASVQGSQPSLQWPSDHFMIIANLSL